MYYMKRRAERLSSEGTFGKQEYELSNDVLRTHRLYVACQVDEDLAAIMKCTGDDNILVGSDFSHADSAQELDFVKLLRQRAGREEITEEAVRKITYNNPRAFYGL
jgi:predicted TIM-barrel fold metal-dependent hydrolase